MMESIRELFRIGYEPSSSDTMAPRRAAENISAKQPDATTFRVVMKQTGQD